MAWYSFEDWSGTAFHEDSDVAHESAMGWVVRAAGARNWSAPELAEGTRLVDSAADNSWTAEGFWEELAETWPAEGSGNFPAGWDKLGGTFDHEAGAAVRSSEARELANPVTQAQDAVAATGADLAEAAAVAKDTGSNRWLWVGLAAVGVGIAAWRLTR